MRNQLRLIMLILVITGFISVNASGTGDYIIQQSKKVIYNSKVELLKDYVAIKKGHSVIIFYTESKREKYVKDGGRRKKLYIEIPFPNRLKEKTYPIRNRDFKVYFSEQFEPVSPTVYQARELYGQIQILRYQKNKELKLKIFLQYKQQGKVKTVLDIHLGFQGIRF